MRINKLIKENNPLVSIIMPVFNAGNFLWEALESVANQTYKDLEIICVNDGSTDESLAILKEFQKRDKRVKIFSFKKNSGVSSAANLAIKKARGKFLARVDADDLIPADRIEKQVKFLLENPQVIVVGGQVELITKNGERIVIKKFPKTHQEIINLSFVAMPIQQGAMMVNRSLLPKNFVWYKEKYKTSEDLDLFFRLFKYGKGANLPDILLYYRQHGNSISQVTNPKEIFLESFKIRTKFLKEYLNFISFKTWILMIFQNLLIRLLPKGFIYPLYYLWRGWGLFKLQGRQNIQPFFRFAFSFLF